jgi:hypothetical protein
MDHEDGGRFLRIAGGRRRKRSPGRGRIR